MPPRPGPDPRGVMWRTNYATACDAPLHLPYNSRFKTGPVRGLVTAL